MAVTLSAVALFGLLTFVFLRDRAVGPMVAVVLFLFGFFTAATGAAGPIRSMCEAIATALNHVA
ncbi:hypothetical protein CG740_15485 [Streptomyces sp. CB01201]|uniref:hypothetical protein n=1 Tax=Streptomyces sp. CB01201 TaxID=2020324 RepID=UPI000C27E1A7|nr:hypothetical protein [Streptomyces sp. CB01201]PJN02441.1 hypothetical protein CG740_15485 [Streptomyces sp. CB01201]